MDSIYGVVYLMRKTSMTLPEIRKLTPVQFKELYDEVAFQESVENYQTATYMANLLAAIANTVYRKSNRTYRAADFLNTGQPRRAGTSALADAREELEALADRFGVKLPAQEIVEL